MMRDRAAVLLAVLATWFVAWWALGDTALASPAAVLARLWHLAGEPDFWAEAGSTAAAFAASAVLSVLGGTVAGCLLGLSRTVGRVVEPLVAAFYALPKVTLYPVVLLLFGLGAAAKVAFGIMHGLVPILLVTVAAVRGVAPVHLRTARALRLGAVRTAWLVVLPAIRAPVAGGIRIGVPLALLGVLIGEMFASRRGLGSMAMRAMERNDTPTLLAIAVVLTAAALAVNAGLARLVGPGAAAPGVSPAPPTGSPARG